MNWSKRKNANINYKALASHNEASELATYVELTSYSKTPTLEAYALTMTNHRSSGNDVTMAMM